MVVVLTRDFSLKGYLDETGTISETLERGNSEANCQLVNVSISVFGVSANKAPEVALPFIISTLHSDPRTL